MWCRRCWTGTVSTPSWSAAATACRSTTPPARRGPGDSRRPAARAGQSAAQLGSAANCGSLTTAILEFGERLVVLTRLTDDASLLLLAAAGADLGPVLYDLRRHGPAIAELL